MTCTCAYIIALSLLRSPRDNPRVVIAHGPLWVDDDGKLVEEPPASGRKLASIEGVVIDGELARMFGLSVEGGKVVQQQWGSDVSKVQDAEGSNTVAAPSAPAAVVPDSDKPRSKVANKNSSAAAGGAKKPGANTKRSSPKPTGKA